MHVLTEQEDDLLRRLIKEHGVKKWSSVAEGIPGRSGKSCRLRYVTGRGHRILSTVCQYSTVYHGLAGGTISCAPT